MINFNVYRETKPWKKPVHLINTLAAKSYLSVLKNLDIVGITGSVGKTLTQNAITSVLSQKFKTITGNENLDPTFRIPQTILNTKPWHQKIVLEYGVEQPGDMDHYLSIAKPKIAVVTQIAPTHLKYFKNVQGVFAEKVKLVEAVDKNGYVVLNADDKLVSKMAEHTQAKVIWYGNKAKASVKISHFTQNLKGSKFRLHYQGQKATIATKVIGIHQLTSFYAAAAVGIISGLTLKQITKGLSGTIPPMHRLNTITTNKINIIDDTYNSSPLAAQESISTLQDLGKHKRKIAVLGEMKDLGEESEMQHELLGQKVAKTRIDVIMTVGKVAKLIGKSAKRQNFKGKIISVASPAAALKFLKLLVDPKTIVLVKGSRHAHLERVVYGLLHKSTQINCYHCGILK